MIKTGEPDKAAVNLQFLIDTGLISNEARVKQIKSHLAERKPGTGPALPTAEGRYLVTPSSILSGPIVYALEKSLHDFITYLDRLGFKSTSELVSIEITGKDSKVGDHSFCSSNPPRIV